MPPPQYRNILLKAESCTPIIFCFLCCKDWPTPNLQVFQGDSHSYIKNTNKKTPGALHEETGQELQFLCLFSSPWAGLSLQQRQKQHPCLAEAAVHPLVHAKLRLWCWEVFYNHMQPGVRKHSAMHQGCRLLLRAICSCLQRDSCSSTPQLACLEGTNVNLSPFIARN